METTRRRAAAATSSALALALANPAFAGDLFGPEYSGAVAVGTTIIVVGVGAISALLLPFVTGTLNPVQMAVNLGLIEGEVSNLRKFKMNGEPMDHGGKFGHKWYKTDAYCNGKYIDFAGVKKTEEIEKKAAAGRQAINARDARRASSRARLDARRLFAHHPHAQSRYPSRERFCNANTRNHGFIRRLFSSLLFSSVPLVASSPRASSRTPRRRRDGRPRARSVRAVDVRVHATSRVLVRGFAAPSSPRRVPIAAASSSRARRRRRRARPRTRATTSSSSAPDTPDAKPPSRARARGRRRCC